jgi:two-component system nitrate/nitrite response regulator NarL
VDAVHPENTGHATPACASLPSSRPSHDSAFACATIAILTPVRLLGESVAACLEGREAIRIVEIVPDWPALHRLLRLHPVGVVLIDITRGVEPSEVRSVVEKWPAVRLLALGLEEQCDAVVRCGRAGFSGYVPRDAGIDTLRRAVLDCGDGRLHCPAEIAGHMMRALFDDEAGQSATQSESGLTHRQENVIQLIGRGLSNKEIARELDLSIATVKHHVHNILERLQVSGRAHVIRRLHGIAAPSDDGAAQLRQRR